MADFVYKPLADWKTADWKNLGLSFPSMTKIRLLMTEEL
jgi:hypothetical protein